MLLFDVDHQIIHEAFYPNNFLILKFFLLILLLNLHLLIRLQFLRQKLSLPILKIFLKYLLSLVSFVQVRLLVLDLTSILGFEVFLQSPLIPLKVFLSQRHSLFLFILFLRLFISIRKLYYKKLLFLRILFRINS